MDEGYVSAKSDTSSKGISYIQSIGDQDTISQLETIDEEKDCTERRIHSSLSKAAVLILLAYACERAAYFTIVNYMNELWLVTFNSTTASAVVVHMAFVGASACLGIFGGTMADTFLRPIPTLTIGYVLFSLGLIFLEFAEHIERSNSTAKHLAVAGLATAAFGQGCIGAVLPVVGAEQLPDEKHRRRYIHWFYLWRNVGAMIADISSAISEGIPDLPLHFKFLIAPLSGLLSLILFFVALWVRVRSPYEKKGTFRSSGNLTEIRRV
ncbi:protein NRT1/ PTR FAMILY 5.14-like [Lingula anatina]|uniref:Protein NRT1/ PTR FAMILY 5.14-like n=1 Tax=Lingula anatina TaxID=7574 RepID=A0A1S3JRT8_LINAN|nr:protein NRT1/ PTR FAMILY 5.14-like [Lingula anatina]|eukprot:XP_013412709.1 protein NRT1/ PTR FAMILY 5.14-like [Lingula anatina]